MEIKEANGRETQVRSCYSSPRTTGMGPQTVGTTMRARKECIRDIFEERNFRRWKPTISKCLETDTRETGNFLAHPQIMDLQRLHQVTSMLRRDPESSRGITGFTEPATHEQHGPDSCPPTHSADHVESQ